MGVRLRLGLREAGHGAYPMSARSEHEQRQHDCCREPPCAQLVEALAECTNIKLTLDALDEFGDPMPAESRMTPLAERVDAALQDYATRLVAAEQNLDSVRTKLASADELLRLARHFAFRAESPGPMLAARIDEWRATLELGGAGESSPRADPSGAGTGDAIPSAAAGATSSSPESPEARIARMAEDAAQCIDNCGLRGDELSGYLAGVLKEYANA